MIWSWWTAADYLFFDSNKRISLTALIGLTSHLSPSDESKLVQMLRNNSDTAKVQVCHELEVTGKPSLSVVKPLYITMAYCIMSWSKSDTLTLEWNMQPPTWMHRMPSDKKGLCSDQNTTELTGENGLWWVVCLIFLKTLYCDLQLWAEVNQINPYRYA